MQRPALGVIGAHEEPLGPELIDWVGSFVRHGGGSSVPDAPIHGSDAAIYRDQFVLGNGEVTKIEIAMSSAS